MNVKPAYCKHTFKDLTFFKFDTWFYSGSLLSWDAMVFSVGSQFFVEKCIFWTKLFYIYFFTNFCVYSITPKLFKVFGWTFIGM